MASPLKISNLRKTYSVGDSAVEAVRGVNFEVKEGEVFGLLGPNGAGKTSIISTITTLEKPTSGQVEVFGFNVEVSPRESKSRVGIVPQEIIHTGFFNAYEILVFQSGYCGIWKNEEHIEYLMHKLDLWRHREKKVKQLSGGMKRRLLIAKALVHKPRLLLLDEPTAGVDIELRESLWAFVRELKAQGISILLTTHYLKEAEQLCDRVAIIHKGEIKVVGETQKIVTELTQREVNIEFVDSSKKHFMIPAQQSVGELLMQEKIAANQIKDIRIKEGDLEEAMMKVLGSAQ